MIHIHSRLIRLFAFLICSALLVQAQAGKPATSKPQAKPANSSSTAPTTKTATGAKSRHTELAVSHW